MKYPLPNLNALNDGAQLDLQFRIALQILTTPGFYESCAERKLRPSSVAIIDAAEFVTKAEAQGWIAPLTDSADLAPAELAHVERQAAANVHGQLHAQKVAQAEQERAIIRAPGMRLANG